MNARTTLSSSIVGDGFGFRRPCGFVSYSPAPSVPAGNSVIYRVPSLILCSRVKRPSPTEILDSRYHRDRSCSSVRPDVLHAVGLLAITRAPQPAGCPNTSRTLRCVGFGAAGKRRDHINSTERYPDHFSNRIYPNPRLPRSSSADLLKPDA